MTKQTPSVAQRYDLYRNLNDNQRRYLAREWQLENRIRRNMRLMRRTPYPLDCDLAAAIDRIVRNFVRPWHELQMKDLDPWVYWHLAVESAIAHEEVRLPTGRKARKKGVQSSPNQRESQSFPASLPPTPELFENCEQLIGKACAKLKSAIIRLGKNDKVAIGTCVDLPCLPLGRADLRRVPLIEGVWVDRLLIELCEWSALLLERGYFRLAASDPHALAWDRFYARDTNWSSPKEATTTELGAVRAEVRASMDGFQGESRFVDGRRVLRFEDYAAWQDRHVQGDLATPECRQEGLVIKTWNKWVAKETRKHNGYYPFLAGIPVFPINHFKGFDLRCRRFFYRGPARALKRRQLAVSEAFFLARHSLVQINPKAVLTDLQVEIRNALRGRAMKKKVLARRVGCDWRTLYKPGGIKELIAWKIVVSDRKRGGYYLRSDPPNRA